MRIMRFLVALTALAMLGIHVFAPSLHAQKSPQTHWESYKAKRRSRFLIST